MTNGWKRTRFSDLTFVFSELCKPISSIVLYSPLFSVSFDDNEVVNVSLVPEVWILYPPLEEGVGSSQDSTKS